MTAFDGIFLTIIFTYIVTVAGNLITEAKNESSLSAKDIIKRIIIFLIILALIVVVLYLLQQHFQWPSAIFHLPPASEPAPTSAPTPAPMPAPTPTSAPTPTPALEIFSLTYGSDSIWTVQVASLESQKFAKADAERLRDEGYNPFIFVEKNSKYYRVAVGAFSSKSDAESLCNELNFNPVAREMNIHGAAVVELTVPSEIPEKYADPRF